jgi:general secretion pathway protein L
VTSSQSDWDLAQGEWAQGQAQRLQRACQAAWQTLVHTPAWRPVRWGLVALIALQVLGLNALAWRERSHLDAQQASLQNILKTTFPSVTLVIDAPLQMQREVDLLQQKSGAVSSTDLEPLLATLASVLPAGQTPAQLHFSQQALRVQGVTPDTPTNRMSQLQAQGLSLRQDGNDSWVLQAGEAK